MVRLFLLGVLALAPIAAAAGTRARYVDENGYGQTILIADNGDFDAELQMGQHLIVRGGRAFIVEQRLTGPLVTPLDELVTAADERAAAPRQPPSQDIDAAAAAMIRDALIEANEETGEEADNEPQPNRPAMTERHGIEVNGWIGRGYYSRRFDNRGEEVFAVISDDPRLARIGAAMFRAIETERVLDRISGAVSPPPGPMDSESVRILSSGTPIQYYTSRLRAVEQVALPSILLPAEPETGAALRARFAEENREDAGDDWRQRMISRAFFTGDRLYLLTSSGVLSSLAEGEARRTTHDLGAPVLDICVQNGMAVAITGQQDRGRTWTLKRLRQGTWQTSSTVARSDDGLIAMSCAEDGIILLTTRRLIDLTMPRQRPLELSGERLGALVNSVAHTTPDAVFVGLNSGEWGGGLKRIDRRSGRVTTISRNATGELCGGPLNTGCDPVQGLATIPWRRDCVAAAIGLVHMAAHGRITSVCPQSVEQLVAVTDTVNPDDLDKVREAAAGGYGSVAFFGLRAIGPDLVAVGHNGLYRIDSSGRATRQAWPRFVEVDGVLVNFGLPDLVLVITELNRRASVSGGAPMLVVR